MRIGRGGTAFLAFWLASLPAFAATSPNPVPLDIRDKVEAYFQAAFVLPQTNIWHFDSIKPYIEGDQVVCGWVNFQSAAQAYVGFHQFYAIVHQGEIGLGQMDNPVEDTTGARLEKLNLLCGRSDPPTH
jgi:hypothetical protein